MVHASQFPKLAPLLQYLESLSGKMNLSSVEQLLVESAVETTDLAAACIFDDRHYQRNKIAYSEWFDLLVLCWKPGQASAIHDHAASSCGFKILSGIASEQVYERTGAVDHDGELVRPIAQRTYHKGKICLAQDRDIHRISNESAQDNLITLHIYSPALHMNVYKIDPSLNSIGAHEPNRTERILPT